MAQRAALYCRVSTEAQAAEDRNSLDAQRDAFTARCIEREYTPTNEFTDAVSGAAAHRALQRRTDAAKVLRVHQNVKRRPHRDYDHL